MSQEHANKASATRKLSITLNYVLDFSDYAGKSNVSSNACIVQFLLYGYMYTLLGGFTNRIKNNSNGTERFDINSIWNS